MVSVIGRTIELEAPHGNVVVIKDKGERLVCGGDVEPRTQPSTRRGRDTVSGHTGNTDFGGQQRRGHFTLLLDEGKRAIFGDVDPIPEAW